MISPFSKASSPGSVGWNLCSALTLVTIALASACEVAATVMAVDREETLSVDTLDVSG